MTATTTTAATTSKALTVKATTATMAKRRGNYDVVIAVNSTVAIGTTKTTTTIQT